MERHNAAHDAEESEMPKTAFRLIAEETLIVAIAAALTAALAVLIALVVFMSVYAPVPMLAASMFFLGTLAGRFVCEIAATRRIAAGD